MKNFISFLLLLCLILSLFSAPGYAEAADDLTSKGFLPSTSEYYSTDTDTETKTVDMLNLKEERAENTFTLSDEVRFESGTILYPMLCRTFTNMYFKSGYITWDDKNEKDFTYFTLEYKLFYNEGEAPAYKTINVSITEGFSLSEGSVVRNGTYPCFKREDTNNDTDYVSAEIKVYPLYSETKPDDLRVNGFPAIPIIDLSEPEIMLELYDGQVKIEYLTYTFGSYSWDRDNSNDDYSKLNMRLSLPNQEGVLIESYTVTLPDGFSFDESQVTMSKLISFESTGSERLEANATIYPLYSSSFNSNLTFQISKRDYLAKAYFSVQKNSSSGNVPMRPTRAVNSSPDTALWERFTEAMFQPEQDLLGNTSVYSNSRALVGCALSQSVYNKNGQEATDTSYISSALHNLGFSKFVWQSPSNYVGDWLAITDYDVANAFGLKKVIRDGKVYNVVMAVVRGTVDTEWIANFEVGGGDYHKNFKKCSDLFVDRLNRYITACGVAEGNLCVFLCGHSRAGAVVDLAAHDLNKTYGQNNIIAYTFAAANSVKIDDSSETTDRNIFNYVYKHDIVGFAPVGYKKYGVTLVVGGETPDEAPASVENAFSNYSGGNTYVGVGSQTIISGILAIPEMIENGLATALRLPIGKLILWFGVDNNWIAKGHSAENYMSWIRANGSNGSVTMDYYMNVVRTTAESTIVDLIIPPGMGGGRLRDHPKIMSFINFVSHWGAPAANGVRNTGRTFVFHCPIDIEVLDSNGIVLMTFDGHQEKNFCDELIAFGDGNSSYLFLPIDSAFTVRIIGTDDGEMSVDYYFVDYYSNQTTVENLTNIPVHSESEFLMSMNLDTVEPKLQSNDGVIYSFLALDEPDSIIVSEENFPDTIFRTSIRAYDTDGNRSLSNEELLAVTTISCANSRISSLKGIEYFTALKKLYCNGNNLTALDVSKNSMLELLACNDNQLTNLDVSKNTKLKKLYCYKNKLTALDISGCNALETLSCYGNQLTVLDTSQSKTMNTLDCSDNYLGSLDLRNNGMLDYLSCANNRLTMLDVGNSRRLTKLYCYDNKLTTLDFTGCIALELLSCYNNALTALDVGQCPVLQYLYCYDNQLSRLDVSKCAELVRLDCYRNKLLSLDVRKNGQLEELACSDNQLESLNIDSCTALNWLNCSRNQLTELDISQVPALEIAGCANNKLTKLTTGSSTALKKLSCNSNMLKVLDVSGYPLLEQLICQDNCLTVLDVTGNSALQLLEADKNSFTSLNISNCPILVDMANNITPIRQDGIVAYIGSTEEGNHQWLYFDEGVSLITEYVPDFILPAFLTEIEEEAFAGGAFSCVLVPETVTSIGSKAFADCQNLIRIVFINGNLDVAEDFVSGCPTTLVIEAPEGSTVADNLELYFRYICPMPEDPGRPGDDDCPEEPETGRIQDISEEIIPPSAGDEKGGFAVFE